VKKLALLLLLAAACRQPTRTAPAAAGSTGGALATPRAAVEAFLQAVHTEDLQAMGAVWGTADGPAREQMDRDTMEKREVVMMCYFRHDTFRIAGETPAAGGVRNFTVELRRGNEQRTTTVTVIPARRGGWYVQKVDIEPVNDWCKRR
jgi:hypothetical protein